jgi:hypothetical protein
MRHFCVYAFHRPSPKSAIATCSVFGDRTLVHAGMSTSASLMTTRSGATSCERKRQYSGCRYRFGAIICRSARLGNRGRTTAATVIWSSWFPVWKTLRHPTKARSMT